MLDTNFFRKFVEDANFFKNANAHLANRYSGVVPAEMGLFVSPIAFLEYLGITVPPPPIPDDLIKDAKPTYESMLGPGGHPKSPSRGHFKFPHLAAQQHDVLIA